MNQIATGFPAARRTFSRPPRLRVHMSEDTTAVRRISVSEARVLLDAGRGVLVDVRGRRLYEQSHAAGAVSRPRGLRPAQDRKSTRLNSSHLVISYAVFCLKKKNDNIRSTKL